MFLDKGFEMSPVKIGEHLVGDGQPAFIIAELGYNFNTLDEALASIDAASEAGCDAIKIQTFKAETLVTKDVDFPAEAGGVNQFQEFKEYEISDEVHAAFFEHCIKRGLIPFSTPSHPDDIDRLENLNVLVYKIGSDDLTNLPLLRYVASTGKPVIFSSGMGTLAEVDEAIQTMKEAGNLNIILLQCVSNYPIEKIEYVNLRVIETFKKAFGIPVGLSDHTTSNTAAIAAVTLGANVVEKHFALSKDLDVPDAFFSADPTEMRDLVKGIRDLEQMLGDGFKYPMPSEVQMREDTRKGIVACTAIQAGQTISAENLIVKRPGWGIAPKDWDRVVGRKATRNIKEDEVITWDMV